MEAYKLFINGEFVDAVSGETFESIDPGTGLPIAEVARAGREDAEAAVQAARDAFDSGVWSGMSLEKRTALVMNLADQINRQGLRLTVAESMDGGQTVKLARFMPLMGANYFRNMANYAMTRFPWKEEIPVSGNNFSPGRDYIRREPIGVCVGIIPWNFPFLMACWKVASAIVMGNTVVLKPATSTPVTAMILAECVKAAGIPDGVVNILTGAGSELGNVLCTHPSVDKVAFTGSTEVGKRISNLASETVKKVTLELGGKSANIILDDADMDLAVEGAVLGTFYHQGQVCESGTRILVADGIYDEFIDRLKARTEALRIGYQLNRDVDQGPLANAAQLETVKHYVELGLQEGATLLTGGKPAAVTGLEKGYFFEPTVFVDVDNHMQIAREEIFGPVACVIRFKTDKEAAAIANDSMYGLGGGIFSQNTARAEKLSRKIKTGTMWINTYHSFGDYCPFGGYKQSGVGRELGHQGLAEYTETKRVHIASFPGVECNFNLQTLSDRTALKAVSYNCPTRVNAGHGCLASIYKSIVSLGCQRALLLADPGVRQAGLVQMVEDAMVEFCVGVFDNIAQDTDLETVDAAVAMARELNADCIVSLGGGSVIDTGKAVCITLKNGGKAAFHIGMGRLNGPQIPHIVVPTTSGTGSEVTSTAVIKSQSAGRKIFMIDPWITPNIAILDPRLTASLPVSLTTSTAMDALTHAIEALTATVSNPFCDGIALHAIRLIGKNLPLVYADGSNMEARLNMQMAATMGGWVINSSQVGGAHALAHTLGALHDIPHGAACGIMLPHIMRFNVDHATEKLALVAQALGVNTTQMEERTAALSAADAVEELMRNVSHPLKLGDVVVPPENIDSLAFHAIGDLSALFNARPLSDITAIADLYRKAL